MNPRRTSLLLIEDDPEVPTLLEALLEQEDLDLVIAKDGESGLNLAEETKPDLILLDLGLPRMSGFDVLKELKFAPNTESIPVIVLTASNGTADKIKGFELGASDYLTKPFQAAELLARLRATLKAKNLQDALSQANRELMAARISAESSARARGEILAHMSHEIRTPLNGIVGMAGLLVQTSLSPDQHSYAETIQTSSESLLAIINDILDFSKIDSERLELEALPLSLRTCLEEAMDTVAARAAEKGLELVLEVETGLPPAVLGDNTRLRQVLLNLLSNGVKFTKKGEIFVRVRALAGPPCGRELIDPWHLHFSVQDTGIGIPADRLARLFKPFGQADASTSRQFGGTGLGLVISRRLVELMQGKMWVESVPGKGSTFHFTLPLKAATADGDSNIQSHTLPHPKNVLILVSNKNLCRVLAETTTTLGLRSHATTDAKQAVEWLQQGPHFDLGIVDSTDPENDGLKVATTLSTLARRGTLPILLMTPVGTQFAPGALAGAGVSCQLVKPVKLCHLREAVLRALADCHPPTQLRPSNSPAATKLAVNLPLQVLICDDNLINQKVAARQLQQLGYQANLAANGIEALAALDRDHYDLILMDLMMPEMDGLRTTRAIRERQRIIASDHQKRRSIVIVAMTASAMEGDREKCLAAGMDDYLAKPVRLDDLRRIIETWGPVVRKMNDSCAEVLDSELENIMKPECEATKEKDPVDLSRLDELTDGNAESLRDLVKLYLEQTTAQMEQIRCECAIGHAEEVRRIAHSAAGASATCGVTELANILREIESLGRQRNLAKTEALFERASSEFQRVRQFLEARLLKPDMIAKA